MVSIGLNDRLIDVVADEGSHRFAVLTRDDRNRSHLFIYEKRAALSWTLALHEKISDSVERVVFVPSHHDLIFLVSYNGSWSTLDLLEFVRGPGRSQRLEPIWTQTFEGRIGPTAVSQVQIAVPVQKEHELHLFAIGDGNRLESFFHAGTISALQYSPFGLSLAAGCVEGPVYVFDQSGAIRWKGDAHDRVTRILYNNSSIQVLAATASGRLIFFNRTHSSDPIKTHLHLSLPLRNILGILELTDGWAAWSNNSLIRIRNNLRFSQIRIDGEIVGMINEVRKRPLMILTDPRHTRLRMEFLPGGKGGTPKSKPPEIDVPDGDLGFDHEMTIVTDQVPINEKELGTSADRVERDPYVQEKSVGTLLDSTFEEHDKETNRCFIIPFRSVAITRESQLVFHTAALPPTIDAGYRISEGDTGFFYDQSRDALIGPVTARAAPELVSMPRNLERISQPPKCRQAISIKVGVRVSTVRGADRILHSFGLALLTNSARELYLSNPILEGDQARELCDLIKNSDSKRISRQYDDWRTEQGKSTTPEDPGIKPDKQATRDQYPPDVEPVPESDKIRAERLAITGEQPGSWAFNDQIRKGITAYKSQQYDAALEAVESAIKQDPQSLVARYLVAEICLKLGENERAEKQFTAAIPPLGTSVQKEEALVAGFAALRLLDYDRANDIFSKLHAADPKNTTAWYGLQIARDRGQTPEAISYPETAEVAGFPIPLHEIAGIHSYTPVNGPQEIPERYFIMPGHSRTIDACEESLVFHTPVQRSVDSGYRVAKGDIGYFYDLGRDSLSGPYFAASAPHFAQMPPDHRSERASGHTKNVLAIPLATKGDVRVTGGAGAILESLGFTLMKTHTGELYLPDPVLVGDRAKRFASLVTKKKTRAPSYSPGEYVMIVDGGFKGQRARIKEIDEEMDKIVVELDGVLLPVPIPLRLQQVTKGRQ